MAGTIQLQGKKGKKTLAAPVAAVVVGAAVFCSLSVVFI